TVISPDLRNELSIQTSRFNRLRNEIRKDLIGSADAQSEQNKLVHSLLEFLDEISSINRFEPIFSIPYPRNPFFTGREGVLAQLRETLASSSATALTQSQAICGLGGIGKTQTAVEYAYRYRDSYNAIFWVKAETNTALKTDFVEIAALLNLSLK